MENEIVTQLRHKFAVTSDWHIGHFNCLEFDKRPFKDLNYMHTVIANNINACLGPDDILYVLGDCGGPNIEDLQKFMPRLGDFTKILITGNHDRGVNAMRGVGFDAVLYSAQLNIMGMDVTLSHCPPMGYLREDCSSYRNSELSKDWHGDHKNQKYSVQYDPKKLHLHGHTHKGPNKGKNYEDVKVDNLWDIGVVGNKYRPIMQSEIESHIVKLNKE